MSRSVAGASVEACEPEARGLGSTLHAPAQERVFEVRSSFEAAGDQPEALDLLESQLRAGERHVVLRGATGTGKSATAAWLIERMNVPTLLIAPNKTLAAQLAAELRELLPDAAVEYFVSHFDYYQPEAYLPSTDTYIEKDSSVNAEVERSRHAATSALLTRPDVVIVASVSCIYGLGSPQEYLESAQLLEVGGELSIEDLSRRLVQMHYQRNDVALSVGTFRVRGDTVEVFPAGADHVLRIEFFGDELEQLSIRHPLTGDALSAPRTFVIPPASHHVAGEERTQRAIRTIEAELEARAAELKGQGKLLEEQRLRMRTLADLEMIREAGFCSGIENYSRHFDGRAAGTPPWTLIDYFPEGFLTIIDESHVTVPQIGGMYEGDMSRKSRLVEFGFRLPSAMDNRPLRFPEFEARVGQVVHLSATPGPYELKKIEEAGVEAVEQVIRPTGLLDPGVEVRSTEGQIDDLLFEVHERVRRDERVLVTVLTKAMAEQLTDYMAEAGVKVRYLHSDVGTLERIELLRDLRRGVFDVLVGINLLREGLDLPEVSLVAILDADKEGFLRSPTALIQTIGRAARNVSGQVIMYADKRTRAMELAIGETDRRRAIQRAYNEARGVSPVPLQKKIATVLAGLRGSDDAPAPDVAGTRGERSEHMSPADLKAEIQDSLSRTEQAMKDAAKELRFEVAAALRDQIHELRVELRELEAAGV